MLARLRSRRPSHGTVVAYLALFVALGGTAYAVDTVGSSDVIDESLLSQDFKNGEVKQQDLANGAVTGGKLAANSVLNPKLAADAVTSAKVLDDSLGAVDLGPASAGTSEVADGAVTSAKVLDGSITGLDVLNGSLGSLDLGSPSVFGGSGGHVADGSLTVHDLGIDSVGNEELRDNAVGQSNMGTNSVGVDEIRLASVGFGEMRSDAISTTEVADGTLDARDVGMTSGRATLNFATIQPHDCHIATIDVPVAIDDDTILVTPNETVQFDLVVYGVDSGSSDNLSIVVCNPTIFDTNPPSANYNYVVFDN
jgi:hypothetical protein